MSGSCVGSSPATFRIACSTTLVAPVPSSAIDGLAGGISGLGSNVLPVDLFTLGFGAGSRRWSDIALVLRAFGIILPVVLSTTCMASSVLAILAVFTTTFAIALSVMTLFTQMLEVLD